jgi:integration host factor subunit beta
MLKPELIKRIAARQHGLSLQDVTLSVDRILDFLADNLSKNRRIEIRNFGNLSLHYREARVAHNPKTGTKTSIPAKHKAHFKPGKELRELVEDQKN